MTPSELAAIEALANAALAALEQLRVSAYTQSQYTRELGHEMDQCCRFDIPALIAEVKRLKSMVASQ